MSFANVLSTSINKSPAKSIINSCTIFRQSGVAVAIYVGFESDKYCKQYVNEFIMLNGTEDLERNYSTLEILRIVSTEVRTWELGPNIIAP